MSAITHIAGLEVEIPPHLRQRCAWCGAVLLDYDLSRIAVPVDQLDEHGGFRPAVWPAGALVKVDGALSCTVAPSPDDQLPADACGRIDPAVTV